MSIQIQGTLLNPSGGNPAAGAQIRFISLAGWSGVPKGAESIEVTSADGSYDFPLQQGRYAVAINQNGVFAKQGSAVVNDETPSPLTIDELMEFSEPLTPGEIKYVEELVAQAELARDKSQQYASESSQSSVDASYEVAKAAQQVGYAEDQVDLAKAEVVNASNEADRAESEADRASEITGLDTVEEAVDMALSEFAGVMTASERAAILAQSEEKYAASGFVHYGKHQEASTTERVNEGLTTNYANDNYTDKVWIGKPGFTSNVTGESKAEFAVTHIAGALTTLRWNGGAYNGQACYLPPAPDGAVIYDSTGDARGTGKANLNLLTEVDPKYGEIAATQNEAVARAFEGSVKNGDFRLGDNGDWTKGTNTTITDNLATLVRVSTSVDGVVEQATTFASGDEIEVEVTYRVTVTNGSWGFWIMTDSSGTSEDVDYTAISGAGVTGWQTVKAQLTAGGSLARVTLTSNGDTVEVSNISYRKVTEEVVTDRVDMFGLEQFDMVIKDDEVFDMVQSQSTTFGDTDVPTVDSVRPDSFFAVYDGQTGIAKGKCVKWSTLTDVQKRKVAAYMKERLWVNEDGDLTFTTIRQRSFAGAGNGDWLNINSNIGGNDSTNYLRFGSNGTFVATQGQLDDPTYAGGRQFVTSESSITALSSSKGAFGARDHSGNSGVAYKGRCFFYVLGTASRLNQGACAKGLNESGAKRLNTNANGADGGFWHLPQTLKPATKAQCFHQVDASADTTTFGAAQDTGFIGDVSGRDDGRFYDAIYADGEGGVVDYRLSAYDMSSPEESAKAWEKVKNGTYRGLEKLVWTQVFSAAGDAPSGWIIQNSDNPAAIVAYTELNTSVSGNFTMTTQWGEPAKLLTAFPNGFCGVWGGLTP